MLDNGRCDWFDQWIEIDVLTARPYTWVLARGPRRVVAEDAYEVLVGPELTYIERRNETIISVDFPPGGSQFGIRTWPPTELNILTVSPSPRVPIVKLEFVLHVPEGIRKRLDLRRFEAAPPDTDSDIPLWFQRPVKVRGETRIGFSAMLSGLDYGVGWQIPEWRDPSGP